MATSRSSIRSSHQVEGDIAPMQPWVGPAPTHIPLHVAVPAGVPMVLGFRYFYSMRVIEGDASALLLNGFYASNQAPPARAHAYGMMRTTSQERANCSTRYSVM